jgi:hypothetical protein
MNMQAIINLRPPTPKTPFHWLNLVFTASFPRGLSKALHESTQKATRYQFDGRLEAFL